MLKRLLKALDSESNACKVDNSSVVNMEEFEALKVKCSALESELETKKAEYDVLMQKCSVLEEYK